MNRLFAMVAGLALLLLVFSSVYTVSDGEPAASARLTYSMSWPLVPV